MAVIGISCNLAPYGGRTLDGAILKYVGIAVDAKANHHDAYGIVLGVVLVACPAWVYGHDNAHELRHIAIRDAPRIDIFQAKKGVWVVIRKFALQKPEALPRRRVGRRRAMAATPRRPDTVGRESRRLIETATRRP
jgi:hypothetical protein